MVRFHLGPPLQVLESPRLRKVRVVDLRGESPMRFSGVVSGRDRLRGFVNDLRKASCVAL